ncbi:MAG: hypothetical protein ACRYF3_00490 [Janthinobacterium lividum]
MAGIWEGQRFVPRFPFAAGVEYALLTRTANGWSEVARFPGPPAPQSGSTEIVSIDPGAAVVPENLLRFSVTFSAPMEEGSAAGRVRLLDGDGVELPGALLEMPPEMWDRPRRRLTVLLEPGRIKRGLVPNMQAGPPLTAGTTVTLVVDASLRDATGAELTRGCERTYQVVEPLRSRVDPGVWHISWPEIGTVDDLVVEFDRPLDRALVARCLRGGQPGAAVLDAGGRHWRWRAREPWAAVDLHIHPDLEDLAGNSVRRVFDRDLQVRGDDPLTLPRTASGLVLVPGGRAFSGLLDSADSWIPRTAER